MMVPNRLKQSYTALISADIYLDENQKKKLEILEFIHNAEDEEVFVEVQQLLLEGIDIGERERYHFIAMATADVEIQEGCAEVDCSVTEVRKIDDLKGFVQ